MKLAGLVVTTVLVLMLLTLSCGQAYHPYVPVTYVPRMVYVGSDVENLRTVAGRLSGKMVYVEITTAKGVAETGRLVSIRQDDLVISPGYYYSTKGESPGKIDIEKIIPKDEITILKIF